MKNHYFLLNNRLTKQIKSICYWNFLFLKIISTQIHKQIEVIFLIYLTFILIIPSCSLYAKHFVSQYNSNMLTSTMFTDMCIDINNNIWIGTEYGLNRFDGVNFIHYISNESSNGLIGNHILRTYIAPDHSLWILTSDGLHSYSDSTGNFCKIPIDYSPQTSSLVYSDICTLSDSTLLLLTSAGLFQININQYKATKFEDVHIPIKYPRAITIDNKHRLFISDDHFGVSAFDLANDKIIGRNDMPIFAYNKYVMSLRTDYKGNAIAASPEGVYRFDDDSIKFIRISDIPTHNLTVSPNGIYCATYDYGVQFIPYRDISKCIIPNLMKRGHANAILTDSNGNLWAAIQQDALYCYSPSETAHHYININELSNRKTHLYSLNSSHDGNIWVGLDKNGAMLITPQGNVLRHLYNNSTPTCIIELKNKNLLIGTTYGGLYLQSDINIPPKLIDLGDFNKGYIKSIITFSDTTILIGYLDKGIILLNNEYHLIDNNLVPTDILRNNTINTLTLDNKGRLWIGTNSGAECFDMHTRQLIRLPNNSLFSASATYMISTSYNLSGDEILWFATNKGLFKYNCKNNQISHYSTKDGLADDNICSVVTAQDSSLWMSTYKGISHLNPEKNTIINYSGQYNLLNLKYSRGIGGYTNNGTIYFGTDNGITFFTPKMLEKLPYTSTSTALNKHNNNIKDILWIVSIILLICVCIYILLLKHKLGLFQRKHIEKINQVNAIDTINTINEPDQTYLKKIESIILDHLDDENFGVELLSKECKCSRANLHSRIKNLTGDSPGNYIRRIRMQEAVKMLMSQKYTVSEVAYAVGFSAPSLFSSAFKRYFGISPSEYKNLKQAQTQK